MKRLSPALLGAFLALGILSSSARADDVRTPEATLESLIQRALADNPELRALAAEVESAQGQRVQAAAWKNPEISIGGGYRTVKEYESGANATGYTLDVSIAQVFEYPGKARLRQAIAARNVHLARLGLEQFRLALAGQVRQLVYEREICARNLAAIEEVTARSASLITLLKERPSAGAAPLLESRVLEGGLVELRQSATQFLRRGEEARVRLNSLLGYPATRPLPVSPSLSLPAKMPNLDILLVTGASRNPQLKIRLAELERAAAEVDAATLATAPDFRVAPFFTQDNASRRDGGVKYGENETNVGVAVSMAWPVWDQNRGNITTARAKQTQAEALRDDARRRVGAEIATRFRSCQIAREQLAQSTEKSIDELRDAADLADRQYRQGNIPIQLFVEVQRAWLGAQRARLDALQEAWNNLLDLELVTGGAVDFTP